MFGNKKTRRPKQKQENQKALTETRKPEGLNRNKKTRRPKQKQENQKA